MRHRLLALVVLLVLQAVPGRATDWVPVVKEIERKVPRVQIAKADGNQGTCSAVFLNASTGFLVTAAHCVDTDPLPHITVAGRDAAVVRVNRVLDLAVLRVDTKKTDVTCLLAKETPPRGTEVAVAGYAFGLQQLSMQFGRMSLPFLNEDGVQLVNIDMVAGDSGGAVLDATGSLVGLVSGVRAYGPMHLGVAIPVETIRDYAESYLPRPDPAKP